MENQQERPCILKNNVNCLVADTTSLDLSALGLRAIEITVWEGVVVVNIDREVSSELKDFLQMRGASYGCEVLFMNNGNITNAGGFPEELDETFVNGVLYSNNTSDVASLVEQANLAGLTLQEFYGLNPEIAEYLNDKWNFYNFCVERLGKHTAPYSELHMGYSIAQGGLTPLLNSLKKMMYFLETHEVDSTKIDLEGYKIGLMVRNIRANGGTGNFKFELLNSGGDVVLQAEQGTYYLRNFINNPTPYYGLLLSLLGSEKYIVSRLLEGTKDPHGNTLSPAQSGILHGNKVYTYPVNGQVLNRRTSACIGTHSIPVLPKNVLESLNFASQTYFEEVLALHKNHPKMARVNIDYLMISAREQEIMRVLLQSGDPDLKIFSRGVMGGGFVAIESNARTTQFSASATNGLALGFGPTVINVLEAMKRGEFYIYSNDHAQLPVPNGISLEDLLTNIALINEQVENIFGAGSGFVLRTVNPKKTVFSNTDEFGVMVGANKPEDIEKIMKFVFNNLTHLANNAQRYY